MSKIELNLINVYYIEEKKKMFACKYMFLTKPHGTIMSITRKIMNKCLKKIECLVTLKR